MSTVLTRALAAIFALGLTFSALALTLQVGTTLELRNDAGDLIGIGKVDDSGKLEFDLLQGQQGFATLTVIDPVGIEETYDAMFNEAGELVVVVEQDLLPLRQLAEDAGFTLDLELEDGSDGLGGPRDDDMGGGDDSGDDANDDKGGDRDDDADDDSGDDAGDDKGGDRDDGDDDADDDGTSY